MIITQSYSPGVFVMLGRLLGRSGVELEQMIRAQINAYETFFIPKGGGKKRMIEAPVAVLKVLQRDLLEQLLYRIPAPLHSHGFVPGRSIVTQARRHLRQETLLNHDLADAFPSTTRSRIVSALQQELGPYLKHRIPRGDRALREALLELIADLVTHRGHLPQGAPTSGAILNLVLAPMDRRIQDVVQRWNGRGVERIVYTRYADDLTLSSSGDLPPGADKMLRKAIHQSGYRFNASKVKKLDRRKGQALVICGLQVDGDALRLPRKALHRYRAIFHHAAFADSLTPELRGEVQGISGLLQMVYGHCPPRLERAWRMISARHGLKSSATPHLPLHSGYVAKI